MDTSVDDGDPTLGRESGIMEIVEREASPVTGAVEPEKTRDDDIEIDTALERAAVLKPPRFESPQLQAGSPHVEIVDEIVVEDDSIEVADDEIESADPVPARPTQPSPPSAGVQRSRPPMRPSARPRATHSNSALPPPRPSWEAPGFGPTSNYPSASRPPASGVDPWVLANRTLELARANARVAELEEQIAFRDARIVTLEERLAKAQLHIDELEQKLRAAPTDPNKRGVAVKSTAAKSVVAEQPIRTAAAPVVTRKPAQVLPAKVAAVQPVAPLEPNTAGGVGNAARAVSPSAVSPSAVSRVGMSHAASVGARGQAEDSVTVAADAGSSTEAATTHERGTTLGAPTVPETERVASGTGDVLHSGGAATGTDAAEGAQTEGDLRRITGIGPRFEAALRRQGITRLSQIAAWSDADVRQVAKALRIPKSRIVKGRWVESAREAIGNPVASE